MKRILFLGLIATQIFFFSSCQKEAGKGGKATLKGTVIASFICAENGNVIDIGGVTSQRVSISYGGGKQYDDDVRSGSGGKFEFKFLNPGKYRVSAISECDTCPGGTVEVSRSIEIGKKDRDVELEELLINDISNGNCDGPGSGGISTASGLLNAIFIDDNNGDSLGTGGLLNERVFLIYGTGNTHSDDERSSSNGGYQFNELRPGNYRVFAYSDCPSCNNKKKPVFVDFEVKDDASSVDIPTLTVTIFK